MNRLGQKERLPNWEPISIAWFYTGYWESNRFKPDIYTTMGPDVSGHGFLRW
jgi:hypothetical protein